MTRQQYEIAVVGGGFAGSILARCLALSGRRVVLFERDRHPRFALGESSTPLANLALERLAVRFDQDDLYALAAHGRWQRDLPRLRGGLKRGFTFYGHQLGREYDEGSERQRRLAVAASPDDASADRQWLRSDVDDFLLRRAADAGVAVLEGSSVVAARISGSGVELGLSSAERNAPQLCHVDFVVDASGGSAARSLGVGALDPPARFETRLVYGHVQGLEPFARVAGLGEAVYPEQWSAVHHMTRDGWMYQLAFDHGVTSVGFVVHRDAFDALGLGSKTAEVAWRELLARYPTLERQFERSEVIRPFAWIGPLQRRCARATGARFALLPHAYAFFGPLFAPGLAWSLIGVERLVDLLSAPGSPSAGSLERYERLLSVEADHLEHLFAAAWREIGRAESAAFERFTAGCQAYFAAASFSESQQRLVEPPVGGWAWSGFLGAEDCVLAPAFAWLGRKSQFPSWQDLSVRFAERNVAGLWHESRRNLYPIDVEALVDGCARIGLSREQMLARRDRLLSPETLSQARRGGFDVDALT